MFDLLETDPSQIKIPADLIDIFPHYLKRRIADLDQLQHLIESKDFETIRRMGHQLKGNAGLFGLDWLGHCGAKLEEAAKIKDISNIESLGQKMGEFLSKVRIFANSSLFLK